MKQTLVFIVELISFILFPLSALAENFDFEVDGIFYKIDTSSNSSVVVVSGNSKYLDPVYAIPETIEQGGKKYSVIGIDNNAFYGCELASITLPSTLEYIGDWAFYNTSISSIIIPSSTKAIGERAFALCRNLTTISFSAPCSLSSIGRSAFSSSSLNSIIIPASVSTIGNSAFASCGSLTSIQVESENEIYESPQNSNAIIEKSTKTLVVGCSETTIPDGILIIGDNAFYGSKVKDIVLPESVVNVGEWSFYSCRNLKSVKLPSGLKTIGERAFALCSELKDNINLLEAPFLQTIGRSAFSSSGIKKITIPKSVVLIGQSAFSSCENLNSLQVESGNDFYDSPNDCNAILQGSVLVVGCSGTCNLTDDLGIYSIGENAFYGSGLTQIVLPSTITTIEGWAFYNCAKLTSITLPEKLNYIEERAFALCSSLREIELPASVKDIERYAFSSSENLRKVISYIPKPFAIAENVFTDETYSGILEVPTGTKELYEQTDYWSNFAKKGQITEFDPSGIASPTIAMQRIYSDNGVVYIESATDGNCNIYSMSGLLMRTLSLKRGTNIVSGISKGIYIINGNKVLVK